MCFCLRASSHGNEIFFDPRLLQEFFFLMQTTLGWHECESTWVTIDLIDIEIRHLGRIKSGL